MDLLYGVRQNKSLRPVMSILDYSFNSGTATHELTGDLWESSIVPAYFLPSIGYQVGTGISVNGIPYAPKLPNGMDPVSRGLFYAGIVSTVVLDTDNRYIVFASIPQITPDYIGAVPTTRTINGIPLSTNVTLDAKDVGAATLNRTALWTGAATSATTLTLSDNISNYKRLQLLTTTNAYNNYIVFTEGSQTSTYVSNGWLIPSNYVQAAMFLDGTYGAVRFSSDNQVELVSGFDSSHKLLGIWGVS